MALHQKYNNEDILSRAVIAGLLNILNNKITYTQVWSNEDIETIQVPWFYNMSGDERFMQDFYTHYAHCLPPKPVDGNFDMIPRGVITYKGSQIDAGRITSRYVQGTYLKEVNGQLQTYRSFLYQIPLNINFDCEMWIDTQVTGLKIEQAIRETFYKTVTFYIYYKGMRLGCSVGFPEDITLEKNIQYSFESNNPIKITFSLQVEAYQPVFDPTTEVRNDQNMTGIGYRLIDKNMLDNDGIIKMTAESAMYEGATIPKGYPLFIEWDYTDENAIINKVDILWSNHGENTRNIIERSVPNNEYYVWNIPQNFTNYKQPIIIWPQDASVSIYRAPIVTILPDTADNKITGSSFYVVDAGYFISSDPDASANIVLEMRDQANKVVYTGDTSIYFTLKGNKLSGFEVPGEDVVFPGNIDYKVIDIYVVNSVTTYNEAIVGTNSPEAFGVIRNVTIV
jgi:hypothetical protein